MAVGGTVAAKETHMAGLAASWTHGKKIPEFRVPGARRWGEHGVRKTRTCGILGNRIMPTFSQEVP